ncbi:MAG: peptide chain release factor N(5)-glutamine methyltransferase [Pseudomonadales bacterium]
MSSTIAELLSQRNRLQALSDTAALDTELLLCHCLQKNRSYLRCWPQVSVSNEIEQHFLSLLARREQGEPIAYLIGERGFWSLDLQVSPATLIPRPETELLVEKSLALLSAYPRANVLDLGTGTGAIALALAREKSSWQVLACDVEAQAVSLAETNRRNLALDNVVIIQSDWFKAITKQCFDLIVSNPPYIDREDPHLRIGDVRFEPRSALVADNKGLADIEEIIVNAHAYLSDQGWLLLEHGYNQGEDVRDLLQQGGFNHIFTNQDFASVDRISGGQWRCAE